MCTVRDTSTFCLVAVMEFLPFVCDVILTWRSAVVNRLDRLRDALLVQCPRGDVAPALQVADRPGTGVVVTADRYDDVRLLAGLAGDRPLLIDAARYAGGQRALASVAFDQRWLAVQRDAGLLVLTDSGYASEDDEKGLLSVLHRTADLCDFGRAGDVVATLALHPGWLNAAGGLERLSRTFAESGCRSRLCWSTRRIRCGTTTPCAGCSR